MSAKRDLRNIIDHTLLKAESTPDMVEKLCREAMDYGFFSVCVLPGFVSLAGDLLEASPIRVCTVVGFPLGASASRAKATEAEIAVEEGADELDMVISLGGVKTGNWRAVEADIRAVVDAVGDKTVKVILETCLLSNEEKVEACKASVQAGAHFVKTSTGFSGDGAKVKDVRLMRRTVGEDYGVKASGGIRDYDTAIAMVDAGANRLGTSSGLLIARGGKTGDEEY